MLAVLLVIYLIVYVALPKLLPLIGVDFKAPFAPTPTPAPTAPPTPTPHPMTLFNPLSAQDEVVFDGSNNYKWFGDPYFYNNKMIFTAGRLKNNDAVMSDMYFYNPDTREAEYIDISPENTHFMFPKFNDEWLVYFDANMNGGGKIMCVSLKEETLSPKEIKQVFTGQTEVMLDGHYIAWTERTGTKMDKLFVCDLNTFETTVVAMFSNSVYGQSLPSLRNGVLAWADTDSSGGSDSKTSSIYSIAIESSTVKVYNPSTYVHDVESDVPYTAWLDAHHSQDADLYYSYNGSAPILIDEGVVEFGLGSHFIAYSKNESIWVYMFDSNKSYRVSPEHELSQFLGVSDDKVCWMDVTSRERDIIEFARIP